MIKLKVIKIKAIKIKFDHDLFDQFYKGKAIWSQPEKECLHLIGYLEPPVAPNSRLIGAAGGSE